MKHVWSTLLGITLGAVPITYLLTQSSTAVAPTPLTDLNIANNGAAEDITHLTDMEARLEKLQARLDQAEGAISKSKHVNPGENGGTPQALSPNTVKADTSEQDTTEAARPEINAMSEEWVAQDKSYQQQTAAALAGQLASEEYDTGWAGNFQAELDQGLKAESFAGTRLSDVECKSSLCRVTLAHDNSETEEQFFEHMLELPIMSNTQAYYQREGNDDGSSSLILYIAREGRSLPLPQRTVKASN